jgi:hypothetical protein
VADWLDVALPDGCVFHHSPNEGKRHINYINRLKQMGTKYGWPDLELFCPSTATKSGHNEAIFIELKAKKGVMNENQRRMRDQIIEAGFAWALCKSIEDVTEFLTPLVKLKVK